jgi:two-component system NarL family response regulator
LKILIVDDNADVRRLIASIVSPLVDDICECSDGAGALALYQAQKSDLILMDIEMPGVDGVEATKRIRAAEPGARIVMLTAHDDAYLRASALSAGACAYVLKDDLRDVVKLLEAMFRGGQ